MDSGTKPSVLLHCVACFSSVNCISPFSLTKHLLRVAQERVETELLQLENVLYSQLYNEVFAFLPVKDLILILHYSLCFM